MEKQSKKTKIKGIDIALIVVAVFDIFFTLVMAQLFYLYQSVPDSLIVAVFGVTFGECGFCTLVYKIKKGVKTDGIYGRELPKEDQTDGNQGYAGVEDLGILDGSSGIH